MSDALERLTAALADRYRIERELGAGGMATVYLAEDLRHDRKVALKVLRPELAAVIGAARFLIEIKTTANLQHPHILSLHDSGEVEGTVFYVMPYVEGESLRDRLNRDKQLPVEEAVRIATEVASALEYAHGHQVIHRDIKPENILLQGNHAVVADFGIALAAVRSDSGTRMTETGMSLGTPHYMSPEQAMGEREITAKSDVYALGCVLYETLTGEPPFTGPTAQAIVARVMTEEPRSLTLQRRTVPRNVEAAVHMALAKLPADRFASASAFAAALADPRFGESGSRELGKPGGNESPGAAFSRRTAVLAGVAAVGTLAGGFLLGRRMAPEPRAVPVQFTIEPPESTTAINRCCGRSLAFAPDGSSIVFVAMRGSRGALYRRPLGRLESEMIPGTEEGATPFFSPDGQWLGFESGGKLLKVATSGGPTVPIATVAGMNGASWGEGDVIAFSLDGRLWTVPATGGTPRRVPTTDSVTLYAQPFMLPGGKTALLGLVRLGGGLGGVQIGVVELSSGKVDTIGFGVRAEYASGYLVFTGADNSLLAQPFDPSSRKTTGPAAVMLSGITRHGFSIHQYAVSGNGWLAYQPGGNQQSGELLRVSDRTIIALPGRSGDNLEDPAISPDGRRIVLRLSPTGSTSQADLWLLDRQQGTLTRFTVGGGAAPVWSRDGRQIAYNVVGDSTVKAGIYVRPVDQTAAAQLVLAGPNLFPGSWTPEGRSLVIVATARPSTRSDIGVVTLSDSVPRWLANSEFTENHAQLSPDGRRLAYTSDRTGKAEIYVQPIAGVGAAVQISTEGGDSPRWSPDGGTLYYVSAGSILAATLAPGAGVGVTGRKVAMETGQIDLNSQNVNWDVFPDGKRFLYIGQGSGGAPRLAVVQQWVELVRRMAPGG
jgi:serine/threonine-protein kinase